MHTYTHPCTSTFSGRNGRLWWDHMHQGTLEQGALLSRISHRLDSDILDNWRISVPQLGEIHWIHARYFPYPQIISIIFSLQWNRGKNRHTCPAFSMTDWINGFSIRKSSCSEITRYMQHHSSMAADGAWVLKTTFSLIGVMSSCCPISSAFAIWRLASLCTWDLVQDPHRATLPNSFCAPRLTDRIVPVPDRLPFHQGNPDTFWLPSELRVFMVIGSTVPISYLDLDFGPNSYALKYKIRSLIWNKRPKYENSRFGVFSPHSLPDFICSARRSKLRLPQRGCRRAPYTVVSMPYIFILAWTDKVPPILNVRIPYISNLA